MASTNEYFYGPSSPDNFVERVCPCGKSLGMHPENERPTCGDPGCDDYLEQHPEWYDSNEDGDEEAE